MFKLVGILFVMSTAECLSENEIFETTTRISDNDFTLPGPDDWKTSNSNTIRSSMRYTNFELTRMPSVPITSFKKRGYYRPSAHAILTVAEFCSKMPPGSYGNPNYDCIIYHVCQDDGSIIRYDTMPCPQALKFNDDRGICDWPHSVDKYCNGRQMRSAGKTIHNTMNTDDVKLDIRIVDGEGENKIPLRKTQRFAESRLHDRVSQVPYYFHRTSKNEPEVTVARKAPHLNVNYPVYLSYKGARKRLTNS